MLTVSTDRSVNTIKNDADQSLYSQVLPALILAQIEPFYIMARGTFIRENSSKMYKPTVFAVSQMISETP